jgi:GxxExxY protein
MPTTTQYKEPPEHVNRIGDQIFDSAIQVHKRWGPGLLEHFYQRALYNELRKKGLHVESEVYLPIALDDEIVRDAYKMDLLVENEVIVELKAVEKLTPVHFQQIRTYLRISNKQLGYLINFNTIMAIEGINRQVMCPKQ